MLATFCLISSWVGPWGLFSTWALYKFSIRRAICSSLGWFGVAVSVVAVVVVEGGGVGRVVSSEETMFCSCSFLQNLDKIMFLVNLGTLYWYFILHWYRILNTEYTYCKGKLHLYEHSFERTHLTLISII